MEFEIARISTMLVSLNRSEYKFQRGVPEHRVPQCLDDAEYIEKFKTVNAVVARTHEILCDRHVGIVDN